MKTKLILIALFAFVLNITTVQAQDSDDELRKAITEMLNVTGSDAMFEQTFDQIILQFQTAFPGQIPDDFWTEYKSEIDYSGLRKEMVEVYMKYFTLEDVQGMMEFYKTEVGQKLLKLTPTITGEAMQIGMDWGKKVSEKVLKKLQDDNIIKM